MDKLDMTHLVPNFILGDRNGWALAKAIETAMQIFLDKIREGVDIALNPDKMPEWRLDELARDENIFWYDFSAPVQVKREMIKNARQVYAMLGTVAGAQRAARDCAGDAVIQEWFEYGGEPAHFRIFSRLGVAAENAAAMVQSVNAVKRLSSVLEGIYVDLYPLTRQLYTGLALHHISIAKYEMASASGMRIFFVDEQGNATLYGSRIDESGDLSHLMLETDEEGNATVNEVIV